MFIKIIIIMESCKIGAFHTETVYLVAIYFIQKKSKNLDLCKYFPKI